MGEYAKLGGQRIKIGTCEDMLYLRYDQRHHVAAEPGNIDPTSKQHLHEIRFRFPWPDEDHIAPGGFENPDRSIAVYGVAVPEGVTHGNVQFTARAGYVTSLPCPEGPNRLQNLPIHRNGFAGPVHLVQQKLLRDGRLVPVCRCGGCGTLYRVEEQSDIEALAVAFRAEGDSRIQHSRDKDPREGAFWHKIADRILGAARGQP